MNRVKNILLKTFIIALVVVLAVFDCIHVAHAAGAIGSVGGVNFDNFKKLCNAVESYKDKTVTIEMYCDWDEDKDPQFDRRLYIPEKCNATLNMHGYRFDRNNVKDDDYSDYGELIYVETGATLTINGSSNDEEKNRVHEEVRVFTDVNQKNATSFIETKGGTLAGGNSSGGPGAIYIDSGKNVTLNDVTIAGCKASYFWNPFVSHTGYGGAILITEDNTSLNLNNSIITGCLAQEDGGGIYAQDDDNIRIYLDNSKIDNNYANSDGGGINLDGENLLISAKNKSSISKNKTNGYGGGIYMWNDDVTITAKYKGDLTIDGNSAEYGGGVYLQEEDSKIENSIITNNTASKQGGGVYINNDNTTINSCTITGNGKYGVYIDSDCDVGMYVTGSTIIKDNTDGNLTLVDDSIFLNFNQSDAAEIHMGYIKKPDSNGYKINQEPSPDYSSQLFADDSGFVIVYNYHDISQDDGRNLLYIRESDVPDDYATRVNPEVETIKTQGAHAYADDDRVYAGMYREVDGVSAGTQYQLRTIYPRHCTIGDRNFMMYYSDGLFFDDPIVYNDHLATASYGMAATGGYLNQYTDEYKHGAARQFMADIGCPDQMIYINDSNYNRPGTDTIGVTIASKTLQKYDGDNLVDTGYTLIAIATRGANYDKEWTSNVTLGIGDKNYGEALGFSEAADQVMEALRYYIRTYDLEEKIEAGTVKFWIAGFSRGGATANIVAKRVIEDYCYKKEQEGQPATDNEVFAYPLEAPKGGTDRAEQLDDKTKYYSIHNLINVGDLVPYVGPKEMGFKRYGVDHYLPGTYLGKKTRSEYLECIKTKTITPKGASDVSKITSVTTYSDNEPLESKKNMDSEVTASYKEYDIRRQNMIDHLATITHSRLFFDYFHPYGTDIISPFYRKLGDFDGAKAEDFLANFLPFLQQEALEDNYREKYVEKLQHLARGYYAEDSDKQENRIVNVLRSAIDKMINTVTITLIFNVIGDYYNIDDEGKQYVRDYLWNTADRSGAFDDLADGERTLIKENWDIIADTVFNFTDGDWQLGHNGQGDPTFPETKTSWVNGAIGGPGSLADNLIYSFALYKNADMIIDNNHSLDVGMAWTRTYDNYYSEYVDGDDAGKLKEGTYKEYVVNWVDGTFNPDDYDVEAPKAYIKDNGSYIDLKESKNKEEYNEVEIDQKIIFEVGEINEGVSPVNITQGDGDVIGEAIYYKVYDARFEPLLPLIEKDVYRGGMYLPVTDVNAIYRVDVRATSLGKESQNAIYYFKIYIGHKVTVDDGTTEEEYHYESGEDVTISANPKDDTYFDKWVVQLLDKDGNIIDNDIAEYILDEKQNQSTVTFTMPEDGSSYGEGEGKYPEKYKLVITAQLKEAIKHAETMFAVPTPAIGDDPQIDLVKTVDVEFTNREATVNYPVVWTYTYEGKTYPATDKVYSGVDYIATITMPKDQANDIVFAPTEVLSAEFNGDKNKVKLDEISITRNDSDGSVTLVIPFKTTDEGGPLPPEATVDIEIKAFDLNLDDYLEGETVEYSINPGDVITITAPEVEDEKFVKWNFSKAQGIMPVDPDADLSAKTITVKVPDEFAPIGIPVIDAQCIPVINNITATIEAPEGGQQMQTLPDKDTLKVTISNQYMIRSDYVKIEWTPEPKEGNIADFMVNYTATISIVPDEDERGKFIYAKEDKEGSEYVRTSAIFNYSETVDSKINDMEAQLDKNNNSISYTFPLTKYTLEEIYPPETVTDIPYGASAEDIRSRLTSVKILLNNGNVITVPVEWGIPKHELEPVDQYAPQNWIADGIVQLPYYVKKKSDEQSLSVVGKAVVNGADTVERAVPSVKPGEYQEDQKVALVSETEGATIFYTTDPTPSSDYSDWNIYDGTAIPVNRDNATVDEIGPDGQPTGRKMLILSVYTYKEGMRPDGPRQYAYIFSNEVNVPKGQDHIYNGDPQIGVVGDSAYTLEPISDGVEIDEDGNATAIYPGTYKVKAKIKEGNVWEIIDPETGETSYTSDDQVITFIIAEIPKCTITYKLDGGIYDRSGADIVEVYPTGSEITIHAAPTKDGYEFLYWRGSQYYPGDKYKVKDNHTFVAVWRKIGPDPIPPYDPPRTGIKQ